MLVNCVECDRPISDSANCCPGCGYIVRQTIDRKMSLRLLLASAILFTFGLGLFQVARNLFAAQLEVLAVMAGVSSLVCSGIGVGVPVGSLAWGRQGAIATSAAIVSSLVLVGFVIPAIY